MRRRTPISTYRLQFSRRFGFGDATDLVEYLAELGITDCYASPYLKAGPGSTHGYDICDHAQLNPEIGTADDYSGFTAALAAHRMGQIVDFVPNHMGADPGANAWWRDVLENGRCSAFADFFDIDWDPIKPELKERILLPILGDQYGSVLERGELSLDFVDGAFSLRYFNHNLPINPRQFTRMLEYDLETVRADLGDEDASLIELLSIITAFRNLPPYTESSPSGVAERHREKEVARERLRRLVEVAPRIGEHIVRAVNGFNGRPGRPETFNALHELLEAQPYRLAYWRTASHEINYRRFFDINQLAGLRMERAEVLRATHALILRLITERKISGLRIDHIDGLFDPKQYLERLQESVCEQSTDEAASAGSRYQASEGGIAASKEETGRLGSQPLYVVIEKILSAGEFLPEHWPVAGTSGYDFLNEVNGLFIARRNRRTSERVYRRFTGQRVAFDDLLYSCKKLIMDTSMASELSVLAGALDRLSEQDRRTRDFTLNSLREALREVVACFPVYRTYVTASGFTDTDREIIDAAIRRARRRNPAMEASIFNFLRSVLLPEPGEGDADPRLQFAMKFQQYTGPVQAKGLEDTAFYRYNLLVSLNEVGGEPQRFGCSPADFHAANRRRRERWPGAMLATSTHDTKRGEDARARLNVLSELPVEWGRHLSVWARINAVNRSVVDGEFAPDRNCEYLYYQTLLGAWPTTRDAETPAPSFVTRVKEYMLKAIREAKLHTSWITTNDDYERAVIRFAERTLTGPSSRRFLPAFLPFQQRIARLGMINSLAQLVLKTASPGVPDFYQGTELWNLSLVDPDNRRPVDYAARRQLLGGMKDLLGEPVAQGVGDRRQAVAELLANWEDGRIKLFLTARALRVCKRFAALFLEGTYEPLEVDGERVEHVVAFARRHSDGAALAIAPRLASYLITPERPLPVGIDTWGSTHLLLPQDLRARSYRNAFTGELLQPVTANRRHGLPLARVLQTCPVAMLIADNVDVR